MAAGADSAVWRGHAISRRDLARWAVLGAGAAPLAALLAACSSDGSAAVATSTTAPGTTTTPPPTSIAATTTTGPVPTTIAVDPARPWWMQGGFAPVRDEVLSERLTVRGSLPPELSGLYVRNGSNPSSGDSPHWFFGDGMVHGVRLEAGSATWYRNRYVSTPLYEAGQGFGQGAPGGANNQSNVSCIWHGGRLLTSGEVGLPFELSVDDLTTRGPFDFAGQLTSAFTAHPKIDPVTGRMHSFGYGFTPPYLTYHVVEADGTMSHAEVIDLPRSTMMHDFAITERDAVFWDLPVIFDLDAAIAFIDDPTSGVFPYRWAPEAGARIGVLPLAGRTATEGVQWFDIDPCYVFHGVNSFRRGDEVVVDVCRMSSMFAPGEMLGGEASLRRWSMNTATGAISEDVIAGGPGQPSSGDLPSRDPRRLGRDYRFAYLVPTRDNEATVDLGGLIKQDMTTGTRETWDPGPTSHAGEWLFVPAGTDDADDAGYLITYVTDESTSRSELVVLDASDIAAGPVAAVELPQRVPYGFHAAWVPA